jgi:hypothetical protein
MGWPPFGTNRQPFRRPRQVRRATLSRAPLCFCSPQCDPNSPVTANLSVCTRSMSGASLVAAGWDGGDEDDFEKGLAAIDARGANGEGETDDDVDATAGGAGCGIRGGGGACVGTTGIRCRCDAAVTDGDLDFLNGSPCKGTKKKKGYHYH